MAEILPEDFGGESLPNGVRIHGWRFETMDGAILRTSELAELKLRLQAAAGTEELLPKLPEAVFGHNKLTMTHESTGYQIKFDAEGALLEWLKNSLVAGSGGLTINAAELGSWRDKVAQMSGDSSRPDWDWTYSTRIPASTWMPTSSHCHGHSTAGLESTWQCSNAATRSSSSPTCPSTRTIYTTMAIRSVACVFA